MLSNMDLLPATPLAIEAACAINLPVLVAALPVVLMIEHLAGTEFEYGTRVSYGVVGCFVPILWFVVGRWIDRRLGLVAPVTRAPSVWPEILFALLVIIAMLAAVAAVSSREWYMGSRLFPLSLSLWSAFGATVLYVRFTRETRRTVPAR